MPTTHATPNKASRSQHQTSRTRKTPPRTQLCSSLSPTITAKMNQTSDRLKINVEANRIRVREQRTVYKEALRACQTTYCPVRKATHKLLQRSSETLWTTLFRPSRSHSCRTTRDRVRPFLGHPDILTTSRRWRGLSSLRAPPSSPISWTTTLSHTRRALLMRKPRREPLLSSCPKSICETALLSLEGMVRTPTTKMGLLLKAGITTTRIMARMRRTTMMSAASSSASTM